MTDAPLSYDELISRLNNAEEVVHALVMDQADAVVSENGVHLLRLHETDRALQVARKFLEQMLAQRTQELQQANEQLRQEIAERKQVEEALRHSKQRLSSIIDSAMDAIITIDKHLNVVIFNSSAERIFGCSAAEAIGRPLDRFIPERYRAEVHRRHILRFGLTEEPSRAMHSLGTLYGVRANGEEFPIEATISHVETGCEKLFTVILRDITQRRQTEAALIRSEKLASVGRVAAMIAHEVNNPLSAIGNLLYLMRSDSLSPVALNYVELAETEVRRAGQIVQHTLGFSRQVALPEKFRICELLDGVLTLLDRRLSVKGIALQKQCTPEDLEIVAVAGETRQVFWNLMTNAIDSIPNDGRIWVRVSKGYRRSSNDSGVRITVADNGIGMGREVLQRMLEPFFTTKSNGTGLGLWVSSEIIKKHGGCLRVRSSTDPVRHGTVFSIFVPSSSHLPRAS